MLSCGFSFNQAFRDYFARQTGIHPFKFTADMATAWRKVKADNDTNFTIQDMLDIYYGKKNPDYAPYDNRACQWNQFYKDFCADPQNRSRKNKIQKAAILWQEIKKTDRAKVYSSDLLLTYQQLL